MLLTTQDVFSYVWHRLRPVLFQPRQLFLFAQQARARLQANGVRTFKQRFLDQVRAEADYQQWIQAYDTLTDADRAAIRQHIERLPYKPLISVVMPTYNSPEKWLRFAIESVRRQLYPYWELCIADDASSQPHVRHIIEAYQAQDSRIKVVWRDTKGHISAASNSALEVARGEFIALLDHDDELAEHALYLVAVELNACPEADILYSDEDKIDEERRRYDPYFKPDWNPDLFRGQNFVSHLGVYRARRVREVGGFRVGYEGSQDWDLALRIVERISSSHIRHIPHVLYHWRAIAGSTALAMAQKDYARAAQAKVLASHFQRAGMDVIILPTAMAHWRIRYPLPQPPPLVSLIVVNHHGDERVFRCVESICQRTIYPHFEIIVAEDSSENSSAQRQIGPRTKEQMIKVVHVSASADGAARYNAAAQHAQGELIGLLSGDLEIISPDWLEEMVSHALRPGVGAVGAMLYYPDDTICHAGIILGGENGVCEAYARKPRGYPGQIGRALLGQNLSAVSAACLILRRELFCQVGGLDEVHVPAALYDIDLCLRLNAQGYRTVWTPHAELYACGPARREHQDTPEQRVIFQAEIDYLQQRWGEFFSYDPAYNPNLALGSESFRFAFPPRVQKPWGEEGS